MRVRTSAVLVLLLGPLIAVLLPTVAQAHTMVPADHGGLHINGTLTDTTNPQKPEAVEGVEITVTTPDGDTVGEATSGPDGRFSVPVEGNGTYIVKIDPESLPEGTFLRNEDQVENTVQVLGFDKTVLFPIGPDTRDTTSKWEQSLSLMANGLLFGLILALAALGLNLIFGTTGLTNFAHGELITFGGLMALFFNTYLDWPFIVSGVLAVVAGALFGWLQEQSFWGPLRKRGTGLIAMMIVSIGFSIFLRYLYQYLFGGGTYSYQGIRGQEPWTLGPVAMSPPNVISMVIAAVVLVVMGLILAKTRLGKATRAVSDNPALAASSGINVDRVIAFVWISGTALASLAGVLLGIRQQVDFQMGFLLLLLVFTAVTLGGLGTILGAMVGALIIGLFIELSTLVVPAELKNVGALAVLIVVLLFRPQGILGRAQRVG